MQTRAVLATVLTLTSMLPAMPAGAADHRDSQRHHHHHHHRILRHEGRYGSEAYGVGPYANTTPSRSYGSEAAPGSFPAAGYGQDPRPNGGFAVDPYGHGNYTRGADGGFGGYPPGSASAEELQEEQEEKCSAAPELC